MNEEEILEVCEFLLISFSKSKPSSVNQRAVEILINHGFISNYYIDLVKFVDFLGEKYELSVTDVHSNNVELIKMLKMIIRKIKLSYLI